MLLKPPLLNCPSVCLSLSLDYKEKEMKGFCNYYGKPVVIFKLVGGEYFGCKSDREKKVGEKLW